MKIYKTNWHGYSYSQTKQAPTTTMIQNFQAWHDALHELLSEQSIELASWSEEAPIWEMMEIDDLQYDQWIIQILYHEQHKSLPQLKTSLEDDKIYQKINNGFLTTQYQNLWEPQAYLPISEDYILEYIDPDEEPMCFGSISLFQKQFTHPIEDESYQAFIKFIKQDTPAFILLESETPDM